MYKQNKIGNQNLNFEPNKVLSSDQCQRIINEFKINNDNNYNYYKKMSFIKLLSKQFKLFKECFILDQLHL